jgi:hypothetical protein
MKVAKILDQHTVAITAGEADGMEKGTILGICGVEIEDPETKEVIGKLPTVRVKVTEVHPKFCVAETYRLSTKSLEEILSAGRASDYSQYLVDLMLDRQQGKRTVVVNVGDDVVKLDLSDE